MRIMLVAYEFPPSPSPQSLRWAYLSAALAARGHEVQVLAPELPGDGAGLPPTDGVRVRRIHAGPLVGWVTKRAKHSGSAPALRSDAGGETARRGGAPRAPQTRLNWKGRLFHRIKQAAGYALFPDIRGEWTPYMRRALTASIAESPPDVVVTSHEPANTLRAGLLASQLGIPWVADLGDPVLATYTPRRWRLHARWLERKVWATADAVTVTTQATCELLRRRHGSARGACAVLSQGYDAVPVAQADFSTMFRDDRLELLYTGSFYRFRKPEALVEAVLATPGVRLSIASMKVPAQIAELAECHPEQLRLLGFLRHTEVLALQRCADVMVNIGNIDPAQIPGKLFEYLGSGRPVLHLGPGDDYAAQLLKNARAGLVCDNAQASICAAVARLRDEKRAAGRAGADLRRDEDLIAQFRWDRIAEQCETVLVDAVRRAHSEVQPRAIHAPH